MSPLRVGVFGGAFDPPHLAHRALAEAGLAQLKLDELIVAPTGQAWHKSRALTPAAHRLAMVRLAFEGLGRVLIDDREIRRSGPSYTLDTLNELRAEQPQAEFYLLLGQDQADALPTWRHWEQIVRIAIICVADRDGLTGAAAHFEPPAAWARRFRALHMPPMDLSATDIRARIAGGQDVASLLSPGVARYIEDQRLYAGADH